MGIAYYNGEIAEEEQIKIPLTDRSIYFGDGIYDAAVGKNGKIYLENEHINRFLSNAKKLSLEINISAENLSKLLREMAKKSGYESFFIYFQLSRAGRSRVHSHAGFQGSNLLITVKEHTLPSHEKALRLAVTEDLRYLMCDIKTLNLLPAVLASTYAEKSGCDEAIFSRNGIITECAHSNIAIVKDGTFYTHPDGRYILPGITKAKILSLCESLSIPYCCTQFTEKELLSADEVLVMSTSKLCLRAKSVDCTEIKSDKNDVGERLILAIQEDFVRSMG